MAMEKQAQPPGFKLHAYEFSVVVNKPEDDVWNWLNDPRTFTDTQYWPFRVEFISPDPTNITPGFNIGVQTNHHGPLVNFAGVITSVKPNYRDLKYYYGSYALSFRLIRPFRLEFATKAVAEGTEITGKISSYVKPGIYSFWNWTQGLFWNRFKSWARKRI